MENMFDAVNLDALIRGIQDAAVRIDEMKKKHSTSTKTFIRKMNEIRLMRESATRRLSLRDRNHPSFFPINSIVVYTPDKGLYKQVLARVEEYQDDSVLIRPIGADHVIKVWPRSIIIHNLR